MAILRTQRPPAMAAFLFSAAPARFKTQNLVDFSNPSRKIKGLLT
jgi:hypothetical protein